MVSLPFAIGSAPPGVRRPVLEVSFGGGSTEDWLKAVVSVTMDAGLAPSVDVVTVQLAAVPDAPSAAVGDTGSVSLGYEDGSAETVFTGQVDAVRRTIKGITRITATNGGAPLSRLRVNQSYEDQAAGQIVSDLAGRVSVSTGSVEDGVSFPFYVIDDRSSAYQHIAALALKSGFLAYLNPDGELMFAPSEATEAVQTFAYGVDIIALAATEAVANVGAVKAIGEGAAGGQGKEAWSWLVKDPASVTGEAGEGEPSREIHDSSLRSSDAATSAAEGAVSAAGLMNITGRLLAPGAPLAVVGSAVEISGAPDDALNGLCLVRRVRHHYTKQRGFTTLITFSKTGEGGLGGLGGLL